MSRHHARGVSRAQATITPQVKTLASDYVVQRVVVECGDVGGAPDLVLQALFELGFDRVFVDFW